MVIPLVYVLIVFVEGPKDHCANNVLQIIIALFLLFSIVDYCLLFLQCYQCDSTTDGPEACNDDPANRCEFQHYHVNWLE